MCVPPCVLFVHACLCLRRIALHIYAHPHKDIVSPRYNGPAEECHRVTQKTKLSFTWHLMADSLNEACDFQLLCRDAARRGVHLPKAWKSKWSLGVEVLPTDVWALEAVQRARTEFSLTDGVKLDCRSFFKRDRHANSFMHTCSCK